MTTKPLINDNRTRWKRIKKLHWGYEWSPQLSFMGEIQAHCLFSTMWHVPGSQPRFSLTPDLDQNKKIHYLFPLKLIALISPFPVPLISVPHHTRISRKAPNILPGSRNPGSKIRMDPESILKPIFMGFHFQLLYQRKHCHIKHYSMDNQAQYSEVP